MVKSNFQKTKPILQDEKNLDYWNDLHDKFDVFLIDKASNIAAIIFKKKYMLKKYFKDCHIQWSLEHVQLWNKRFSDIISNNLQFYQYLVLDTRGKHKSMPFVYCMPKLH